MAGAATDLLELRTCPAQAEYSQFQVRLWELFALLDRVRPQIANTMLLLSSQREGP